ncbi:MAG: hypothetical protein QOK05_2874 [Chloroflexota bacterium]|jgi:hypothetical protein|nr:hypothetical protein [Chloroflexota bacterium]
MLDGYLIARIGLLVIGLAFVSFGLAKTISGRLLPRPWSGQVFSEDQAAFSSLPAQRIRILGYTVS